MISHTQITHVQHTQTNRLIHIYKYILTPPGMCSKQLPALEWINNLQAIIYFTQVYIVFDFQKLLTYRSYMTAWSKYSKNRINKENIHIHRDLTLPFWEEIEKFSPPPAPPSTHYIREECSNYNISPWKIIYCYVWTLDNQQPRNCGF